MRLDFRNFHYLFFPDFMFENLELTCHLTSFHDKFIVAPSGWKPPDAASVCRESTQILQNCETCSRSAQAPLTLKVNPLLISTCSLNTNIRCHIFRAIRCEKHVVWQPSCFVTLRYSIQRHTPAGEMHSEFGKPHHCLTYDVPETAL